MIFSFGSAVAASATIAIRQRRRCDRRSKLRHRERHGAEQLTRIIRCSADTLLVGDNEIGGVDEILRRTNQPHQREDAERDHQTASVIPSSTSVVVTMIVTGLVVTMIVPMTTTQRSRKTSRDARRNVAGTAATTDRLVTSGL